MIFRVTQESLSNIAKHAGARDVEVELSFVGRTVLRVRDDGGGFDRGRGRRVTAAPRPARRPRAERHARARAARRRQPGRLHRAGRGHHHRADHGSDMRILIADDHGIVRGGLRLLIERQPDMEVVAEAEDGVDAFEQALADQARPVRHGRVDAAHDRAAGGAPDPRAPARDAGPRAVDARRRALRVRRAEGRRLRLRAQARGRPGAAQRDPRGPPRRRVPDQRRRAVADPRLDVRRPAGPDEPLSPREQEVLKLIAEAHTNKQIAEILHLAEKTVESHRANLLRKLGMRDRVELVRYAIRRGLTEA